MAAHNSIAVLPVCQYLSKEMPIIQMTQLQRCVDPASMPLDALSPLGHQDFVLFAHQLFKGVYHLFHNPPPESDVGILRAFSGALRSSVTTF